LPRPPRIQVEGGIYHLGTRGVRKTPTFLDDADRRRFLALFQTTLLRYGWELHTYCLMTNHFHLLVTTPKANLSAGMQYLNSCYAQWFNRRHGIEGHFVERRFYSGLVETDEYLLTVARYIVLNPVRAGLCRSARDWRWSSYRGTLSTLSELPRPSTWLLSLFGRDLERAREQFAAFVLAGEAELRSYRERNQAATSRTKSGSI
jgi:REP element-mobilizing transposase RayT